MKIELTPEVQAGVQQLVESGQFPSVEAAVNYGASLLHTRMMERDQKMNDLRSTLSASIARGGHYTADEVRLYLAKQRIERENSDI